MLKDFVRTDLNADQVGDLLTMAGFELEGIEEVESEPVLDIKVVSNRGDGLSVFGLAREVLAKHDSAEPTDLYSRAAARFPDSGTFAANSASVAIETDDCTRYACRIWEGIENASAPDWIQLRLRQAGMRPISRLVDLTNYVMLELGQPLHAFDLDKLAGGRIVVRKAREGESLTTLDGKSHELRTDQMMICDAERPVAAAGIMGGAETEVDAGTTRVLLESAHFVNTSVRRTRKQLGLNTEASYRFERSVDPEGVVAAIARFTELLGEPGSQVVDLYPIKPVRKPVALRVDRAEMLLGMEIGADRAKRYLERLGMSVEENSDVLVVQPPTWRPDIIREEDLIEELGRVNGYEKIPETLPAGTTLLGGPGPRLRAVDVLREAALAEGFDQLISHSLRDFHPLDAATGDERIGPRVPASPEHQILRDSIWPSLADAAARNGGRDLHLFELGRVFSRQGESYTESREFGLLSTGTLLGRHRKNESIPEADFASLKGSLDGILARLGYSVTYQVPTSADRRCHPTRQAELQAGRVVVGKIAQIHPRIANELGLAEATFLAEIYVEALLDLAPNELSLKPISRNPAVRRDIALLIDKSVPFAKIESAVQSSAGPSLEKHWLFDVFDGTGIPEGKHSLGIGIQLRKLGANFTDEEANQVRESVVAALAELGGSTR